MQFRATILAALLVVLLPFVALCSDREPDPLRYDPVQLTSKDPILATLFKMAKDVGFRIGVWGGPVRDLMLTGQTPPKDSDIDLVYDSLELEKALEEDGFRKRGKILKTFLKLIARHPRKMKRYAFMNLQPVKGYPQSVHRLMRTGGLTLNQAALMSDGAILQFNNGFQDLKDGQLRYFAPRPITQMMEEFRDLLDPSPYDVLRAVRFKTQYPSLEWAPGTLEKLHEIMAAYGPESPWTKEIAGVYKGIRGKLRKWMPRKMSQMLASEGGREGKHQHRHLRPYIEKGFDKVIAYAEDPVEALSWIKKFQLDIFAEAIGMGDKIETLRKMAEGKVSRPSRISPLAVEVPRVGSPTILPIPDQI
jgi:hypothetical protein